MSFQDFTANFTTMEICHLTPESFSTKSEGGAQLTMNKKEKKRWHLVAEYSAWRKNVSAGGCRKFLDTFSSNPQFHVEVTVPEEGKQEGTLIVGLMQKDNREERKRTGAELFETGFMIYEVFENI